MALLVQADRIVSQEGGFEPQRQNNFGVEIIGLEGLGETDNLSLAIESAFAPMYSTEEIAIPFGNEVVYAAGRSIPVQGQLVIRDFIEEQILGALMSWRRAVYDWETGAIGLARQYKKSGSITLFGPNSSDNNASNPRIWEIEGLWPIDLNPAASGLTMQAAGLVTVSMTLRYDRARPGDGIVSPTSAPIG